MSIESNGRFYISLDEGDLEPYVPPDCRSWPEEYQPEFLLRPLTRGQVIQLDKFEQVQKGRKSKFEINQSEKRLKAYDYGCQGWRKLRNKDGNEIPFTLENKAKLPIKYQAAIGRKLLGDAGITEIEEETFDEAR